MNYKMKLDSGTYKDHREFGFRIVDDRYYNRTYYAELNLWWWFVSLSVTKKYEV